MLRLPEITQRAGTSIPTASPALTGALLARETERARARVLTVSAELGPHARYPAHVTLCSPLSRPSPLSRSACGGEG